MGQPTVQAHEEEKTEKVRLTKQKKNQERPLGKGDKI